MECAVALVLLLGAPSPLRNLLMRHHPSTTLSLACDAAWNAKHGALATWMHAAVAAEIVRARSSVAKELAPGGHDFRLCQ